MDLAPAERKALKALTRGGQIMLPDIAKRLGIQGHSARAKMSRLKAKGLVEVSRETKNGGGYAFYKLTPLGVKENRRGSNA